MGLNLKDYEYELPNTIFGTVAYMNASSIDADVSSPRYDIIIIPQGRTFRIDHLRFTHGPGSSSGALTAGIARSMSPTVYGNDNAGEGMYSTRSEADMVPWSRLAAGGGEVENTIYDDWGPTPRTDAQMGGRLWHYLTKNTTPPDGGLDVVTPERGPIWMQSGDAMIAWQYSNPSTTGGYEGTNHRCSYIMSYTEFF